MDQQKIENVTQHSESKPKVCLGDNSLHENPLHDDSEELCTGNVFYADLNRSIDQVEGILFYTVEIDNPKNLSSPFIYVDHDTLELSQTFELEYTENTQANEKGVE